MMDNSNNTNFTSIKVMKRLYYYLIKFEDTLKCKRIISG